MKTQEILDLDKNEQILHQVHRHPIGLIGIYFSGAMSIGVLLSLLYAAIRIENPVINLSDTMYGIIFGILIALMALFTYIGVFVYTRNELVLTNENIIQILQFSLLNRQVSQLNLAKVQDVSVDQVGILATFFKYGTIEIETAGEASNFRFILTPHPNIVAKMVIEAHEDYQRRHSGQGRPSDI